MDGGHSGIPDAEVAAALPPDLVYVSDRAPGITRRRSGRGFSYRDPCGRPIRDEAERARLAGLGIPPAWRDVWICPRPEGHLQATGIDADGRKQYRYHPAWTEARARAKYDRLAEFGCALARLRARIDRDLAKDPGELAFSLAAVTVLLDRLHLRVGSAAHSARNRTYGATTLLNRHLQLDSGLVRLQFRAKGGRYIEQSLRDRRLHRIFEEIDELPGRRLFTWISDDGTVHPISSQQVNAYIAACTGLEDCSAKTFRTWAGSLAAFSEARRTTERLTVRAVSAAAAARLHNTPAICRSSYIHPAVLDLAALDREARAARLAAVRPAGPRRLQAEERRLIGLLRQAAGSQSSGS